MKKNKKGITAQTRLILAGLGVSTAFILLAAGFATYSITQNMNSAYKNFAQVLSKTLAIEGVEVTKEVPELAKYDALRANSVSVLNSNDDIAFIIFKDNKSKIIYSSKDDYPDQAEKARITVSSPMVVKNLGNSVNVGSVTVGLSGSIIDRVSATSKTSLAVVFVLAWLVIVGIIYMNSSIITRELRKLHQGVKKISTGEFGYMIDDKDVDSEVKELYSAFNDMSERLSRYNEQTIESLTFERNKLESVLMSIVNGVVVCDNHDKVIMVNNYAKRLLEVEEEDILHTQIQQFCDSSGEFCFADKITQFKDTPLDDDGAPIPFNIEIDRRILKCLISPMFTRSNSYVGYIIVLIDVTKDVEMDQLRSNFISNVSHELKTPIALIQGYAEGLQESISDNPEDMDYYCDVIIDEAGKMNKMVKNLLTLNQLEFGDGSVNMERFDIISVIAGVIHSMQIKANEKQVNIEFNQMEPIYVWADEFQIEEVITNYLSNALNHVDENRIIQVKIQEKNGIVRVSVFNTGKNIPENELDNIWVKFYKVDKARTRAYGGNGIGLSIVKAIMDRHEKKCGAINRPDGVEFWFELDCNSLEKGTE